MSFEEIMAEIREEAKKQAYEEAEEILIKENNPKALQKLLEMKSKETFN